MKQPPQSHFPYLSKICERATEVALRELRKLSNHTERISRYIKKHPTVLLVLVLALNLYVASYFVLSRRGFAEADMWNAEGFYFSRRKTQTNGDSGITRLSAFTIR